MIGVIVLLALQSALNAYFVRGFNAREFTGEASVVCKARVMAVREDGEWVDPHFSPPLKSKQLVATLERVRELKAGVPEKFEVQYPAGTPTVGYTDLTPGQVCLLFLKRGENRLEFIDPHNGTFPAVVDAGAPPPPGATESQQVQAEIIAVARHGSPGEQLQALEQLGTFRDAGAIAVLRPLYTDADTAVRGAALAAGLTAGDAPPIESITAFFKLDPSNFDEGASFKKYRSSGYALSNQHAALAWAIGQSVDWDLNRDGPTRRIEGFDYVRCIREALNTPAAASNEIVRRELASTLRALGDQSSTPELFRLLDDSSADVRYYAATALERIYHQGKFPAIDTFAADEKSCITFWKQRQASATTQPAAR
jgi:HEAT repeat protein